MKLSFIYDGARQQIEIDDRCVESIIRPRSPGSIDEVVALQTALENPAGGTPLRMSKMPCSRYVFGPCHVHRPPETENPCGITTPLGGLMISADQRAAFSPICPENKMSLFFRVSPSN